VVDMLGGFESLGGLMKWLGGGDGAVLGKDLMIWSSSSNSTVLRSS